MSGQIFVKSGESLLMTSFSKTLSRRFRRNWWDKHDVDVHGNNNLNSAILSGYQQHQLSLPFYSNK